MFSNDISKNIDVAFRYFISNKYIDTFIKWTPLVRNELKVRALACALVLLYSVQDKFKSNVILL